MRAALLARDSGRDSGSGAQPKTESHAGASAHETRSHLLMWTPPPPPATVTLDIEFDGTEEAHVLATRPGAPTEPEAGDGTEAKAEEKWGAGDDVWARYAPDAADYSEAPWLRPWYRGTVVVAANEPGQALLRFAVHFHDFNLQLPLLLEDDEVVLEEATTGALSMDDLRRRSRTLSESEAEAEAEVVEGGGAKVMRSFCNRVSDHHPIR